VCDAIPFHLLPLLCLVTNSIKQIQSGNCCSWRFFSLLSPKASLTSLDLTMTRLIPPVVAAAAAALLSSHFCVCVCFFRLLLVVVRDGVFFSSQDQRKKGKSLKSEDRERKEMAGWAGRQ